MYMGVINLITEQEIGKYVRQPDSTSRIMRLKEFNTILEKGYIDE